MNDKKIKVLCVEDERDIRDAIVEILQDEGFEVASSKNGKEGFATFLEFKPNIIISDVMMPELDGYGLLKLVRESRDKNNMVPFIFLSALGQKENIVKGVNLSANDYLIKPVDFDILIAKIREKTNNASKLQKIHESGIKNIKEQISTILPSEVFSYLDSITQIAKILKEEPYGPFVHRKYLDDINKIYFDAIKLKTAIVNSLDHQTIDNRLNANEEIFSFVDFIDSMVNNLPEKIRNRVIFERPYESEFLPKIKIDKSILIEIIKKIIAGIIRFEADSALQISIITNQLNQMVMIFYISSKLNIEQIKKNIDLERIEEISEEQGCYCKISENKDHHNVIISIPSFRMVN